MTPHSSILAWKVPRTEEPGGLPTVHGVAELDPTVRACAHRDHSRFPAQIAPQGGCGLLWDPEAG